VIAHAVWLYFRFHLSFRDVEELLSERGIVASYGAIRPWCYTFGPSYATNLRRRRARPGDKWHLDEVLLTIRGKHHWLWRAVDQNGVVLDILVQERRHRAAAERFLRQVLGSRESELRVVITRGAPPAAVNTHRKNGTRSANR
jgi:putative transposase